MTDWKFVTRAPHFLDGGYRELDMVIKYGSCAIVETTNNQSKGFLRFYYRYMGPSVREEGYRIFMKAI